MLGFELSVVDYIDRFHHFARAVVIYIDLRVGFLSKWWCCFHGLLVHFWFDCYLLTFLLLSSSL